MPLRAILAAITYKYGSLHLGTVVVLLVDKR